MAKKQYLDYAGLTTYDEQIKAYIDSAAAGKADSNHSHDDKYYTESEIDSKLSGKANSSHNHAASNITSGTLSSDRLPTVPVAKGGTGATTEAAARTNLDVYSKSEVDSALSGKAASSHNHDTKYDAKGAAASALESANDYTDEQITALLDGADDTTLDSIKELADAIKENDDAIEALNSIAAGKANATHSHAISDVTNLQSTLNAKAAQTSLDSHTGNTTVHITATERTNWNAAKTHADSAHAPSNAQPNQNAFSNVKVGSTTVAADTTTDTLEFVGSNVTITPDATNDKVTFTVADGSTSAKGVVQLTNSTSSTSTTTAATPSSVKSAYDLANTANTAAGSAAGKADAAQNTANEAKAAAATNTQAISSNTSAINSHTSRIGSLETLVGDGYEAIPTASITALFS